MPFTDEQVTQLYIEWLSGATLRQLGHKYGVGHGSIHLYLRRKYGRDACSPKQQSLVRSVLEDNPNSPELAEWALKTATSPHDEQVRHMSKHNLQMLSKYQTLTVPYLEDIETAPEPPEPWLEPAYVMYFIDQLVMILAICLDFAQYELTQ